MNFQQMPRHCNEPGLFQYWNDIKRLFTSRFGDDGIILQYDYSQLELRILAVFSQDKNLIGLYRSGVDLHRAIASQAFGIPADQITKDQRTASKKVQFGIVYQESSPGLAEDLQSEGIDITVEECDAFIESYFKQYPSVKKWIDSTKRFAKRHGYVKTKTNRIRHLQAIHSTERSIASEAERQAVNAPIQSTGSDCTLQALIQINKWLKETGKQTVICGTVHDSIVLDVPKSEALEVAHKVKDVMEHLAKYHPYYSFIGDVPIVAEAEIGYSYGESFECTPEELEEYGIDGFLQKELDKKKQDEIEKYEKWTQQGVNVPVFIEGYWDWYKQSH